MALSCLSVLEMKFIVRPKKGDDNKRLKADFSKPYLSFNDLIKKSISSALAMDTE